MCSSPPSLPPLLFPSLCAWKETPLAQTLTLIPCSVVNASHGKAFFPSLNNLEAPFWWNSKENGYVCRSKRHHLKVRNVSLTVMCCVCNWSVQTFTLNVSTDVNVKHPFRESGPFVKATFRCNISLLSDNSERKWPPSHTLHYLDLHQPQPIVISAASSFSLTRMLFHNVGCWKKLQIVLWVFLLSASVLSRLPLYTWTSA